MSLDALYALLHYLAMFAVVAALAGEMLLCTGTLDAASVRRLTRIDAVFFIAALAALAAGLARALLGTKGWAFYAANLFFWIKIGTFAAVGLVSILPTIAFLHWRKTGGVVSPKETARIRRYLWIEAGLLGVIPVCAALMARGIGTLS